MKNIKGCSQAALILALIISSAPLSASDKGKFLQFDVDQARVINVSTKMINGFVNTANGRNCVAANVNGVPTLLTCTGIPKEQPIVTTFTLIQMEEGQCLADSGAGPRLKTCDINDPSQQWDALATVSTHVKNINTKKCLTAKGLNAPVALEKCTGAASQSWKLPQ